MKNPVHSYKKHPVETEVQKDVFAAALSYTHPTPSTTHTQRVLKTLHYSFRIHIPTEYTEYKNKVF